MHPHILTDPLVSTCNLPAYPVFMAELKLHTILISHPQSVTVNIKLLIELTGGILDPGSVSLRLVC